MTKNDPSGAALVCDGIGKRLAQEQRRGWRAKQRAANLRPLSTKVVHPRVLVDAPPKAKKGRVGK